MTEQESLLSFLFDRDDIKVHNVKFFRGNAEKLTTEQMCRVARMVIEDTFQRIDALENVLPVSATS